MTNAQQLEEAAIPGLQTKIGRVIHNRRLRRIQHVHSAVMTIAGLAGVIGAVYVAVSYRPVSALDIGIFLAFFFLIGMGLTIGYHRHFTHRSYQAHPAVRAVLAVFGMMAGQGPVVFWVALHRFHHEFSDKEGDPHSPNLYGRSWLARARGLFHAYIGWTVEHDVPNVNFYARDILNDRLLAALNRRYYYWVALGLALPAAIGGAAAHAWSGAVDGFLWGGLIRMFALHNIIWWITSFAHVWGTHDYESKDLSTNNFWIALPTLGESWHNNHHAFPTAAVLSFRWWQMDISGLVIRCLERCGVVWSVSRPDQKALQAKQILRRKNEREHTK